MENYQNEELQRILENFGESALTIAMEAYPTLLTCDDVSLVQPKEVGGFLDRNPVHYQLEQTFFGPMKVSPPIFSAPMDTVTDAKMSIFLSQVGRMLHTGESGAMGVIHRNFTVESGDNSPQAQMKRGVEEYQKAKVEEAYPFMAVGLRWGKEYINALVEAGCCKICVDVAKGCDKNVIDLINWIKKTYSSVTIMAGNVAHPQGVIDLALAGAHIIRVGIGPGHVCITRQVTGFGGPQWSTVVFCAEALRHHQQEIISKFGYVPMIVADGGIKSSGDVIKLLAAGASGVMIGTLFAGYNQSPGEVVEIGGEKYKYHRGMASLQVVSGMKRDCTTPSYAIEGASGAVPYKGSMKDFLNSFIRGLTSGLSYAQARTWKELKANARFVRVTPAGIFEAGAKGIIDC